MVIFTDLLAVYLFDNLNVMNEIKPSFINRLRKHRRLMGYTQGDVAYLLGLQSKTEISRWEKGRIIPLADKVIRLAYIYHTFAEELFRESFKEARSEIEPREKKLAQLRSKKYVIKQKEM
jgi:transcriptional regulator with XRE-family HTH domain